MFVVSNDSIIPQLHSRAWGRSVVSKCAAHTCCGVLGTMGCTSSRCGSHRARVCNRYSRTSLHAHLYTPQKGLSDPQALLLTPQADVGRDTESQVCPHVLCVGMFSLCVHMCLVCARCVSSPLHITRVARWHVVWSFRRDAHHTQMPYPECFSLAVVHTDTKQDMEIY